MPLKDDFIARALEQLAEAVRALTALQSEQNAENLRAVLEEAYREHTGSKASLFHTLPSEQILHILKSAGTLDREKAFLMAKLFQAEAALAKLRGDAQDRYQLKALDLSLEAALADLDMAELDDTISELEAALTAYNLPELTEWRRFDYAAYKGNYAHAEDLLFGLAERFPSELTKDKGRSFYQTLRQLTDDKLVAGNLSRAEVEEGLRAFEALVLT